MAARTAASSWTTPSDAMKGNVTRAFAAARFALFNQNSGFLSYRAAGIALLIRVAGAAIAFLSQTQGAGSDVFGVG